MFVNAELIHESSSRLDSDCSVFQSELLAIRNALLWIKDFAPHKTTVAINTDSQSALKAIKQFNNTHPIVVNIIELHTVIRHEHLVFFNWVRAHNGDPFNDRADMLA